MPTAHPWTPLPSTWRTHAFTETTAVLLESSAPSETEHHSYLFTSPTKILTANHQGELPTLFEQIEAALSRGHHVAGWFAYEAGEHFLNLNPTQHKPVAVLGIFNGPQVFDHHQPQATILEQPKPLQIAAMPTLPRAAYNAAIQQSGGRGRSGGRGAAG